MKTVICVVDRIEESYAVCIPDDRPENPILIPAAMTSCVREGTAVAVTLSDKGEPIQVRPATQAEHVDQRAENAWRLRRLFDRGNKTK